MNFRGSTLERATRLSRKLASILRTRKHTIAFAESCTGGLLSAIMTQHPGVSDVFIGSVVSYSNFAKTKALYVRAASVSRFGAVSREVAIQMSRGARRRFSSDIAISITGIAGPTGGTPQKPVGTVHFAVATHADVMTHHACFRGSRQSIQAQAALCALQLAQQALTETSLKS